MCVCEWLIFKSVENFKKKKNGIEFFMLYVCLYMYLLYICIKFYKILCRGFIGVIFINK